MEGTDTLILIDAVHSHSKAGTIFRFTIPQDLEKIRKAGLGHIEFLLPTPLV